MAYNGVVFAGTLLDINVAASGALVVLNPLLAQIDFTLFGSLGIGALKADLDLQLSAALSAQANLAIGSPLADLLAMLAAIALLEAQILQMIASGAVPLITVDASLSLSASVSFSAMLALQIGGLELMIQAALAARIPAVNFAAQLAAALSAGPLFVLSFEDTPMSSVAASLSGDMSSGLTYGANYIAPSDHVYGILIITKAVSAWGALQATMLTA